MGGRGRVGQSGAVPSKPTQGVLTGKSVGTHTLEVTGRSGRPLQLGSTPKPPRKASMRDSALTVPQTDTGGQVENTKVNGIPFVKELGKLAP
jgi:hypothetical protein